MLLIDAERSNFIQAPMYFEVLIPGRYLIGEIIFLNCNDFIGD